MNSTPPSETKAIPEVRQPRFESHALVEIRRFKSLPIFAHSAILLDISESGFKVEFTSEAKAQPGQCFWLNIQLAPIGIPPPARLRVEIECKWYDDKRYRIGGTFLNLSDDEKKIIGQIVEALRKRGALSPN